MTHTTIITTAAATTYDTASARVLKLRSEYVKLLSGSQFSDTAKIARKAAAIRSADAKAQAAWDVFAALPR